MNGTNGKYRTLIFLFVYTVNTFVVFFFFFFCIENTGILKKTIL